MKYFSSVLDNLVIKKGKAGFTLVEMMVAVAIFFIITGAVLINVPRFRSRVDVDLVAGEAILYVRSSQVYALGTKEIINAEGDFPGEFYTLISLDDNSMGVYGVDESGSGHLLEEYEIPSGYEIRDISCGVLLDNMNELKIIFKKPNPEVYTMYYNTDTECDPPSSFKIFSISEGNYREITVNKPGHIGIK